jgi:cell division protein FtsQ
VKSARVVRMLPDTIVIAVTQRPTLAVWQHDGRVNVIDNEGHLIPEADAARFGDLPLVVGAGANDSAAAILPVLRAHPRVMERLDALVRVDERRWDLRLKDGGLVQLPAVGEDSALIELDKLDQKSRILDLGFARIDLRDPELVAVRPRDPAPPGKLVADGA